MRRAFFSLQLVGVFFFFLEGLGLEMNAWVFPIAVVLSAGYVIRDTVLFEKLGLAGHRSFIESTDEAKRRRKKLLFGLIAGLCFVGYHMFSVETFLPKNGDGGFSLQLLFLFHMFHGLALYFIGLPRFEIHFSEERIRVYEEGEKKEEIFYLESSEVFSNQLLINGYGKSIKLSDVIISDETKNALLNAFEAYQTEKWRVESLVKTRREQFLSNWKSD